MKKLLLGLSLLACGAAASAATVCVSFAPAGYCDSMQYDGNKATWINYDCGGSQAKQTFAFYGASKAFAYCKNGSCDVATNFGWDSFTWKFDLANSLGTLTGKLAGDKIVLQQDMPVAISAGACTGLTNGGGGTSSLSR